MIVAGHLKFTALGRVRVIQANPIDRSLTPTILGVLCYTEEPPSPADYNDELGYALNGSICAQLLPAAFNEIPSKGLRIATEEPITHYWMGLPITADGRLAVFAGRTMQEHFDDEERERYALQQTQYQKENPDGTASNV